MNLYMNLNGFKKCNVWINECRHRMENSVQSKIESCIEANTSRYMQEIKIEIELSCPRNTSNYAMIGFTYLPNKALQNKTIVSVCLNNELQLYKSETLVCIGDKVFIGIPTEYGDSILVSTIEYINTIGGFPSGEIIFNVGAHAECGSSKAIFKKVTELVLEISQFDLQNMTSELIQEKIELLLKEK